MLLLKYLNHPLWDSVPGSKLTFKYDKQDSVIHSLEIEMVDQIRFQVTMWKTDGNYFYQIYGDKSTTLKYICDWMNIYKNHTLEIFVEVANPNSPKTLRQKLSSLHLSPRMPRSSSPRTPRSDRSEYKLTRTRSMVSPRSRSANNSPRPYSVIFNESLKKHLDDVKNESSEE